MKKTYRDYVNAGICPTCKSKPKRMDVVLCEQCYEKRCTPERKKSQRALIHKYIKNNRSLGLCDRCKNPRVEGKTECQKCIDRSNELRIKKRKAVFDLYGGKCFCCGEDRWEFLTIDHVNGNGNKERKSGFKVYHLRKKLLIEGKPNAAYQILCMNCNFAKGIHGYCPHQSNK